MLEARKCKMRVRLSHFCESLDIVEVTGLIQWSGAYDSLSEGSREGRLKRPKAAGATVQALERECVKV